MQSTIRTFVLAAIAAASMAAAPHTASAQYLYGSTVTTNHVLPWNGIGTINALILPYAGTYLISGQQVVLSAGNQETSVFCWTSTTPGTFISGMPSGPYSQGTITGGWITLPLNGYFYATGRTEIYVECEYNGPSAGTIVETLSGNITATLMQ